MVDFFHAADTACGDELASRDLPEFVDDVHGNALHQAFGVNVRVEECAAERVECAYGFFGRERDRLLPTFDCDAAVASIDSKDEFLGAELVVKFTGKVQVDSSRK